MARCGVMVKITHRAHSCVSPVASRFAIGTPALPRNAPQSVTINRFDVNCQNVKCVYQGHVITPFWQIQVRYTFQ